ncbi:hypothetical protein K438DRAFT_1748599 [Mycena galopus ATCC 62051]|nr:hypothetical protein K438DRAFT_1748599 [Mycena galopus ATCC 62051]
MRALRTTSELDSIRARLTRRMIQGTRKIREGIQNYTDVRTRSFDEERTTREEFEGIGVVRRVDSDATVGLWRGTRDSESWCEKGFKTCERVRSTGNERLGKNSKGFEGTRIGVVRRVDATVESDRNLTGIVLARVRMGRAAGNAIGVIRTELEVKLGVAEGYTRVPERVRMGTSGRMATATAAAAWAPQSDWTREQERKEGILRVGEGWTRTRLGWAGLGNGRGRTGTGVDGHGRGWVWARERPWSHGCGNGRREVDVGGGKTRGELVECRDKVQGSQGRRGEKPRESFVWDENRGGPWRSSLEDEGRRAE